MLFKKIAFKIKNKAKKEGDKLAKEERVGLLWREVIDRWIWIILLVAAVVYFKYLLAVMHTEIISLTKERQAIQKQLELAQKENLRFYQLQAEINKSIEQLVENLEKKRR